MDRLEVGLAGMLEEVVVEEWMSRLEVEVEVDGEGLGLVEVDDG